MKRDEVKAKVWLIWNPNGHAPTYPHQAEDDAISEAERLALANPGAQFIVLESIGEVQAPVLPPTWKEHTKADQATAGAIDLPIPLKDLPF